MKNFLFGFALGWMCLAEIVLLLMWPPSWEVAEIFAYVIAPFATIAAGALAMLAVMQQINTAKNLDAISKASKLTAVKPRLCLALSKLIECCDNNTKAFFDHTLVPTLKEVDDGTFESLERVIEYADSKSQRRLANIIKTYQTAWANSTKEPIHAMGCTATSSVRNLNSANFALQWATLGALCDQAFPFAREMARSIPDTSIRDRIIGKLMSNDIHLENYDFIREMHQRRFEADSFEKKWDTVNQ